MITGGKYSVWFKTPIGHGAGLVEFDPNGQLSGGDTTFAYAGRWRQDGERFEARRIATELPLDPVVVGLGDMVRKTGYVERQLRIDLLA